MWTSPWMFPEECRINVVGSYGKLFQANLQPEITHFNNLTDHRVFSGATHIHCWMFSFVFVELPKSSSDDVHIDS